MTILNYKTLGNGPKHIIFLHELLGDNRNYESIYPFLDLKNFTYIFVDLRGYGLSKEITGSYTCEEASNDLKNLILHLNLEKVIILAHSMSTMIAQKLALIDSEHISKLILITPISPAGIKIPSASSTKLLNDMKNDDGNIEDIVISASKRYNQAWRDYRIDIAYSSSILEARVGYMNMYLSTDFLELAKEINIPIKIIVGKYDFQIFALKTVNRIFSSIYKDLEIIECSEAGHYPMIECPAYFASRVEEFSN